MLERINGYIWKTEDSAQSIVGRVINTAERSHINANITHSLNVSLTQTPLTHSLSSQRVSFSSADMLLFSFDFSILSFSLTHAFDDHPFRYQKRLLPPFFSALQQYANNYDYRWPCLSLSLSTYLSISLSLSLSSQIFERVRMNLNLNISHQLLSPSLAKYFLAI